MLLESTELAKFELTDDEVDELELNEYDDDEELELIAVELVVDE
jgi:hypothetical protein